MKLRKADAKLNDTFEGRSNNSFNASGISSDVIRKDRMPLSILPAALIRALDSFASLRIEFKVMSYEDELIATIRDSSKWPSFERPLFLDELADVADDAFAKSSIEGYLASLLIYHQLSEEMVRLLLKDAQFFVQLSVFPAEILFPEKKRLMFGQLIDELKATISFTGKDEFISKCLALNTHRIDIVHRLTKRSSLSDVGTQIAQVKKLYYEIYDLFTGIHDWFRVSFKDFEKDVFIDY